MICKKCGEEIENGLMYCPKCGESIQLVPDYDELEEELLSKVVEDKDKSKDDKFATGVYHETSSSTATSKSSEVPYKPAVKEPLVFTKKIKTIIFVSVIGIAILGCLMIIPYMGTHTYDKIMNNAVDAENQSQYAKALGLYEEAYALDSTSFEAIYGLGRMYYRVKDYENAIKMLDEALKTDPTNKKIYTYLISSYDAIGDMDSIYALAEDAPNEEIQELISAYIMLPPTFSVEPGNYDSDVNVQLTCTGDYQIFYTTNGKSPITSGKLYSKPIALKEGSTTIKAVTQNSSGEYSSIVIGEYNITYPELTMPVVSPTDGIYTEPVMISIDVPDGCQAYYTWDGTDPSKNGILYTEPFPILSGSSVLSVVIIDENGNISPMYRGDYIYQN